MTIEAAVDGSSLGNPGPAGWAWVVDEDRWDAGGWPEGTNNLGELTAVLELLKATEAAGLAEEPLRILADSQYAINVVTKWRHSWKRRGWTKTDKQPIKNLELIQEIDRVIEGREVSFEWVKGHAGHAMNEKADELARGCAQAYQAGRVPAGGPRFTGAIPAPSAPIDEGGSRPVEGEAGSSPADGEAAPASSPSIPELERRMILAWAHGDGAALDELAAPDCARVWPNGQMTPGLAGPVPPGLKVGRFELQTAGSATLVCYSLSWDTGSSLELSVWTEDPDRGPLLLHHQSTPISEGT